MKYADAELLIKDGDIIFVRGINALDKLICRYTNSNYSHVAIACWATIDGQKRLMVVEAQGNTNRRLTNLSFYANLSFDVISAPVQFTKYSVDALSGLAYVKYSYITAFYTGLRDWLLHKFHWTLPSYNFSGEICSEFVGRELGLQSTDTSPQDIYNQLISAGYKISISVTYP